MALKYLALNVHDEGKSRKVLSKHGVCVFHFFTPIHEYTLHDHQTPLHDTANTITIFQARTEVRELSKQLQDFEKVPRTDNLASEVDTLTLHHSPLHYSSFKFTLSYVRNGNMSKTICVALLMAI